MSSPTVPAPLPPPQPANANNTNQAHLDPLPPSVFTLPQTAQLEALYTIIRDSKTSRSDFLFYSDRIIRLLVEEGLNHLPVVAKTVETPTVCEVTSDPPPSIESVLIRGFL
jgi:uracil phosphoribosyltransferase